ncbi:MAG: D-alanyl-D-alanine carboxypeptidase [Rhodospirillales bacterium]|nr:D-alanyl-D-alanine carboxypeptidase [Rhodospirillales bacterium]
MSRRLPPAKVLAFAACCLTGALAASQAAAFETAAREAILVDAATGAVLFEKDADVSMPPASMSKIMTIYMVFESLKDGRLSLDDKLTVSEKAWRMGGSKMFVEVGDEVRVEDLLRGVIVQSGNDACIVLAEALGGSEEGFAQAMTERAREIGLTGSSFANATGWPHPEQRMTARDLATLALRTIENFPDYYGYYAETSFVWSDIKQGNRNPLLYKSIGADGLKTGHTEEAGYGLTGSAVQDGRRLILVINGLSSIKARAEESHRLLAWGFREFDNYALLGAGETVEEADVWQGELETVPLVLAEDLVVTLPRKSRSNMKVKVRYDGPVPSPIAEGQEIAALVVSAPEIADVVVPLLAGQAVERQGPVGRLFSGLRHMILGGS